MSRIARNWKVPDRRIAITADPLAPIAVAAGLVALVTAALYVPVSLPLFGAVALVAVAGWLFIRRLVQPAVGPAPGSWLPITLRTLVVTACTATISIIPVLAGFATPFTVPRASTLLEAIGVSIFNAGWTSIVEECINAAVMVSVAAVAFRLMPALSPSRIALIAISAGALVRLGLHLPLWGLGFGLSKLPYCVAIAVVFWFTRALWPLVLAHFLWDLGPLLAALSPVPAVSSAVALVFGLLLLAGIGYGLALAVRYWASRKQPPPGAAQRPLGAG